MFIHSFTHTHSHTHRQSNNSISFLLGCLCPTGCLILPFQTLSGSHLSWFISACVLIGGKSYFSCKKSLFIPQSSLFPPLCASPLWSCCGWMPSHQRVTFLNMSECGEEGKRWKEWEKEPQRASLYKTLLYFLDLYCRTFALSFQQFYRFPMQLISTFWQTPNIVCARAAHAGVHYLNTHCIQMLHFSTVANDAVLF